MEYVRRPPLGSILPNPAGQWIPRPQMPHTSAEALSGYYIINRDGVQSPAMISLSGAQDPNIVAIKED